MSFYSDFEKNKHKNKKNVQTARSSFTSGQLPTLPAANKSAGTNKSATSNKQTAANKPAAPNRNAQTTTKVSTPSARSSFTSGALPTLPSGYKVTLPTKASTKPAAQKQQTAQQPLMTQLQINSQKWHTTSDAAQRNQLHQQNNAIRKRLGLGYANGVTYGKDGRNLSLGVQMLHSGNAASARHFNDVVQSSEFNRNDKLTARPNLYQAVQGVTANDLAGQTGVNAHKAMRDLFNRSDETWSKQDTRTRDNARKALTDEMSRIFQQYGLEYVPRDNTNAADVMRKLRRAGADNKTLAYVQENMDLRDASDRLGEGLEAVAKRWAASIPSLKDTAQQQSANTEQSRQSKEYRELEQQEQTLELTLQGMNSTDADGKVPADYQAVYNKLQDVRKRKNELAVQKGVDPNKWSQRMLREANEAQQNAEAGLAAAPRWLTEQGISLAGNAPTMAASAIPVVGPAIGSAVMGAQAAGQRAFELNEQGKSAGEALGRGLTSGIIEAASEKLPLEKMADILHAGGTNAVKNVLRQMGVEASEEAASYFMNYVADLAANDPDAKFSLAELAQSAAGGAFGGLVFGTAGTLGARAARGEQVNDYGADSHDRNFMQELQRYDTEYRAAQNLPEGPAKSYALHTTEENLMQAITDYTARQAAAQAELTAMYDSDLNSRMLNEQQAQATEWEQQRENVERYRNQIDGTFDGSLPTDMDISLGQTPKVLQSLGAEDLPLRMTQNVARKIAYPDGYMGGKHNLGIPALKQMQQQLNDPIAVLKSKSQKDSFVVLTKWNDAENNPVIAAIHLNKQGVVDDVNMLASAYGKRNLTALLGENNENVIYTKNNKGIYQTLDDRLRLPGLLSDDTLVAYSIRQNAENNNSSAENVPLNKAMQYGKTPQQAMMEAEAKAEGERVRQAREAAQSVAEQTAPTVAEQTTEAEMPMQTAAEQQIPEEVKPFTPENLSKYGKSEEHAAAELHKKLESKRSFAREGSEQALRAQKADELRQIWDVARPVQEKIEKFRQNNPLSAKDENYLQAALVNGATDTFRQCDDPAAVLHLYQMQREYNTVMQPIYDFSKERHEAMALNAEDKADMIAEYAKDKKIPGAYSAETMERNSYDIFGKNNRDMAQTLNDEYFTPVHRAVADRTNYINTMREQVADLHLNKQESALVQMLLEGEYGGAAEYMKNNNIKVTSEMQKRVADGVSTFQAIYKELYYDINETLLSNGMEPVRARKNYAPHFVKDKADTVLGKIRFAFGLGKDSSLSLPTDLAGVTDDFKPGKKWFGNLLQREGEITDYDAVAGFDRYIETAGDVIFLTDSVQNLRSLEDALRYRLSDEGTKAKVDEIRNNISLNALERHQQIEQAYDTNEGTIQKLYNQRKQGMGGYVSNLHEYINNLAGKKARADRGWEEMIGRQMYNVAKNVEGRVAANMIALNPGSWVTNFIPITQASGEVSTLNLLKAMRDTVKSAVKDDGFADGSVFLTNREGTQFLDRTLTRRVSDLAGMPMEAIDHFTSNVVTRGKFLQNIQNGMSTFEAYENADAYAASLMADRSKGAQPTAFNSVNPVRKVFTMFQLEVNNQLRYLFKDLPQAKQSVPKLAWAYTKIFTGAYLFNQVYHQLTGRDSAFDPIGMIADAFGIGDDDDKKKKPVDIALDLGANVAEQLPFIGGVLGGGRVPISAAFPDVGSLVEEYRNGYDSKRIARDAGKQAINMAAYLLPPFGGGAIKRTAEGYGTVKAGGSYSLDKNGDKILQFPQYGQSPRDWAQAMLFGKSSLQSAQQWSENSYDSLNAKETKAYETLKERMHWSKSNNPEAVYAAIKAMRAITDEAKAKYPDGYGNYAADRIREMLMANDDLTIGQKNYLDRELVTGGATGDYTSESGFQISQNVRDARQSAAYEAVKHGVNVDDFAKWDDVLVNLGDEYDEDGTATYTTNEKLGAIMEQINQTEGYTDGMKQALADYVLISAMSKTDREKWTDEVQGKVNASDYVRFKSDISQYNKEFKGTGTDNSENVAQILKDYTNLNDEQRDVLMNVYSETVKNNPFHVSDMEKKLTDNSFYKDLNDEGKSLIRSYCNEYEQAIADGKDLSGWKAKAYMAKEAGISAETYALFQTALKANDYDGNGSYKSAEITAAVKCIPGLTDKQRGYLWQAAKGGETSKNNPWGATSVTAYTKTSDSTVNPVEGGTISSPFGPRNSPTEGASTSHKAIDIAAPLGTPVKAVMAGKVTMVYRGDYGGYGNTVEITHANGLVTKYHHMQNGSLDNISVGQEVSAGQQIGKVGSTGISTGPHLDFQVEKDGNYVDPRKYIPGYGSGNDYVYSGSASAGTIASGKAAAASSGSKSGKGSKSGGSSSSSGLKKPKKPKGLG